MQSGQQTPAQSGWRRPQAEQHQASPFVVQDAAGARLNFHGVALAPVPRPSVPSTRRPGLAWGPPSTVRFKRACPESIATTCAHIPSEVRACVCEYSVLLWQSVLAVSARGAQSRATCVLNPRHTCVDSSRQGPRPRRGRVHACDMAAVLEVITCMQPCARVTRARIVCCAPSLAVECVCDPETKQCDFGGDFC